MAPESSHLRSANIQQKLLSREEGEKEKGKKKKKRQKAKGKVKERATEARAPRP